MSETEKKAEKNFLVREEAIVEAGETYSINIDKEFPEERYGTTQRKLTPRHVSLMIIGQSIGSANFVGIENPLLKSGSLSLFLAFAIWSTSMVWPLMLATGEMCSYLPIEGTFLQYSARWLDPAMGFAVTIIYIYTSLMFMCVEIVAFASIISYWTPLSPAIWITIAIITIFVFNVFGVNWYGELEFLASILKVLLIVGLMIFSLITMCGGNPLGEAFGMTNWLKGGLMKEYLVEGTTGQFLGFWSVLVWAAMSCGGPDMLGMVSGEICQPRKSIGTAAKRTYFRILVFYVGGVFFMNVLCASNNSILLNGMLSGKGGAATSPWVVGIKTLGVKGLDSLVNAAILSSAWSCSNGFLFGATRSTYSAALVGYLPKFFTYCTRNGCPIVAVGACCSISALAYMSASTSANTVFNWFTNLSTTGILCTFTIMWLCYFKFKKAVKAQDVEYESFRSYKPPKFLHPYVSYFAFGFNITVLFFNGFWVFFPHQFAIADLFTSYFAPVFTIVLYFVWKFWKKTKWISVMDADITTGKEEIDREEDYEMDLAEATPKKEGFFWKVWYKISDWCFT